MESVEWDGSGRLKWSGGLRKAGRCCRWEHAGSQEKGWDSKQLGSVDGGAG